MNSSAPEPAVTQPMPPARFDLTLSENPFPPLPSVLAVVNEAIRGANRYPEFLPRRLPAVIAAHLGVDPDQVVVGAGATGVVLQIMQAVSGPGRRMVLATRPSTAIRSWRRWRAWKLLAYRWIRADDSG